MQWTERWRKGGENLWIDGRLGRTLHPTLWWKLQGGDWRLAQNGLQEGTNGALWGLLGLPGLNCRTNPRRPLAAPLASCSDSAPGRPDPGWGGGKTWEQVTFVFAA